MSQEQSPGDCLIDEGEVLDAGGLFSATGRFCRLLPLKLLQMKFLGAVQVGGRF